MPWTFDFDYDSYESALSDFTWEIPDEYNIAVDCVRKHADGSRPALYQFYPDSRNERYTFDDLDRRSDALANALESIGVERGDRVAVAASQRPATPLTHLACWKIGAVSVPLSVLEGVESLRYRLDDAGVRVLVAEPSLGEAVADLQDSHPDLDYVGVDDDTEGSLAPFDYRFGDLCDRHSGSYDVAETTVDTPAILIYTSGTTGRPKGVLHGHGVWLGSLPGFNMYFEGEPDADDVFFTTSDWSWIAGLGNVMVPAWHYGRPVVGDASTTFDAERVCAVLETFGVTKAYLPPTAVRMLMTVDDPHEEYDLALDVVGCGGEAVTPEVRQWSESTLDVRLNESYGQTEANVLVSNRQSWFETRPGSMGKPVPGHEVAVVDPETGTPLPRGEVGQIAVRKADDPMVFDGYWNRPQATSRQTVDGWHLTGDLAKQDADGYLWYESRSDSLIITSGYRVSPVEVEQALLEHDAVNQALVTGVDDEERGEIIAARVVPAESADSTLEAELQEFVRDRLAQYKYPREITFVDELPTGASGKVERVTGENTDSER